jgi:uncharacterized protein YgiM (DUF1202 family)
MFGFPISRMVAIVSVLALGAVAFVPAEGTGLFAASSPNEPSATSGAAAANTQAAALLPSGTQATTPSPPPVQAVPVRAAAVPPVGSSASAAAEPAMKAQPAEPATESYQSAWVGRSAVNLRAGPSLSSTALDVLRPGTPVKVSDDHEGWSRVQTSEGVSGWVSSEYLADHDVVSAVARSDPDSVTEPREQPKAAPRYARVSNSVEARARPSGSAQALIVIKAGQRIAVLDRRGRWLHVAVNGGVSGWIPTR